MLLASPGSAHLAHPWHASLLGKRLKDPRRRSFTCRGRPGLRQMASTAPSSTRFAGSGLPCLPRAPRPPPSGAALPGSSAVAVIFTEIILFNRSNCARYCSLIASMIAQREIPSTGIRPIVVPGPRLAKAVLLHRLCTAYCSVAYRLATYLFLCL